MGQLSVDGERVPVKKSASVAAVPLLPLLASELRASVGSDKSKLLTANIWLEDVRDWDEMNEVWTAWIDPEQPPVRATVGAMIAKREYVVEIMVTAAR